MKNKALKKRIIKISYKHKLSHLGSCLTSVDIIKEVYDVKKINEKFVLSSGHAGLALYCVLESMGGRSAEDIFNHHGVHPDRCNLCGLDVSTGSLGQGLPIALGMALADRSKNVYCLISDGELMEGSIHEVLRIKKVKNIDNLIIYLNFNGWGAYKRINKDYIADIQKMYEKELIVVSTNASQLPFLGEGVQPHYYVMNEVDHKVAMEILK